MSNATTAAFPRLISTRYIAKRNTEASLSLSTAKQDASKAKRMSR